MFMLGSHHARGGSGAPSLKPASIHETVTYPRIKPITAENNSCLNPTMASEHILACGHIINTQKPYEPCAPNCHHIQNSKSEKMKQHVRAINDKEFYCDACVEGINETFIPEFADSTQAEHMRAMMRRTEAFNRRKDTKYRKCYIGFKVTSVPCHSDGSLRSKYMPRAEHHPFDKSFPQIGENMFEDLEIDLPKVAVQKRKEEKAQDEAEAEASSGEITGDARSSQEDSTRADTTPAVPSAAKTGSELGNSTRPTLPRLPAQPGNKVSQARSVTRTVRNSPSIIISAPQHKSSSQPAIIASKSTPKRKRLATETSENRSDKENEQVAPPASKRAKTTPSVPAPVPAGNKEKATPRRSKRLSSKKA